jgi:hypothetical protein
MKRRESLKVLVASSGALLTLPAWARNWTLPEVLRHTSSFTTDQQIILASVADTIIPQGNAIGAISVGVDKFLQKLIDDCYTAEVQHKKGFNLCDQKQRETLLTQLESGTDAEREAYKFFKNETIRGFTTSREVLVNYYKYKSVPGHYYGCVDVNS